MSQDFPPQDPLAFIKGLWANAGLPFPLAMPPADVDALDRKITELKAVQAWLQTNLAMLQSTIQMLEMQKAGAQAMQNTGASSSPQATDLWLKTLQQYQDALKGGRPDQEP